MCDWCFGLVNKPDPHTERRESDESHQAFGTFVVARCDSAGIIGLVEEPLDVLRTA